MLFLLGMSLYTEPFLLFCAMALGAVTGSVVSVMGPAVDFMVLSMLFFLFYGISLEGLQSGLRQRKYLGVAWAANFLLVPVIGYGVASLLVEPGSALFIGLMLYLIVPCTDWFLVFTKIAKGNVELNSVLLPINLLSQLLLLPLYLWVLTASTVSMPVGDLLQGLVYWLLTPLLVAQVLRYCVGRFSPEKEEKSTDIAERGMTASLVILVFSVFNAHIMTLVENVELLPVIFLVIVCFFCLTYGVMQAVSWGAGLDDKERASLTVTTLARNSPLVLGLSLALFPGELTIHFVLIIGMVLEIPLLMLLTYWMRMRPEAQR